jgi:hypothetical protein
MSDLQTAQERLNVTLKASFDASQNAAAAAAEWARLALLEVVDQYPQVVRFTFGVGYEYDDEGGYFPSVSIYPEYADGDHNFEVEDEMIEIENSLDPDAVAILAGPDLGPRTIAELREVSF